MGAGLLIALVSALITYIYVVNFLKWVSEILNKQTLLQLFEIVEIFSWQNSFLYIEMNLFSLFQWWFYCWVAALDPLPVFFWWCNDGHFWSPSRFCSVWCFPFQKTTSGIILSDAIFFLFVTWPFWSSKTHRFALDRVILGIPHFNSLPICFQRNKLSDFLAAINVPKERFTDQNIHVLLSYLFYFPEILVGYIIDIIPYNKYSIWLILLKSYS